MKTLTQAVFRLSPPGGVFNETVVLNLFPDRTQGARELLLDRALKAKEILRLKRGTYVLAPVYRKTDAPPFTVAALLLSPSQVSLETALAYHGLIPEAVYQVASVCTRRSRMLDTPLGVFSYHCVPTNDPRAGVEAVTFPTHFWAYVATPLRAIADMVYLNRAVTWRKDGVAYLFESLRIEELDLQEMDFNRCAEITSTFRSRRVKEFLRGMQKEFSHDR
jgi:predicted transcriptional regulator of viral defense system